VRVRNSILEHLLFSRARRRPPTVLKTRLALPTSIEDVPKSLNGKAYHDQTFATIAHPRPPKFSSIRCGEASPRSRRSQPFSCPPPDLERLSRLLNFLASSKAPGSCPQVQAYAGFKSELTPGEGLAKDVLNRLCGSPARTRKAGRRRTQRDGS